MPCHRFQGICEISLISYVSFSGAMLSKLSRPKRPLEDVCSRQQRRRIASEVRRLLQDESDLCAQKIPSAPVATQGAEGCDCSSSVAVPPTSLDVIEDPPRVDVNSCPGISTHQASNAASAPRMLPHENDEPSFLASELSAWSSHHKITFEATSAPLQVLKKVPSLSGLPKDARTLRSSPRVTHVRNIAGGTFVHFGIGEGLCHASSMNTLSDLSDHIDHFYR